MRDLVFAYTKEEVAHAHVQNAPLEQFSSAPDSPHQEDSFNISISEYTCTLLTGLKLEGILHCYVCSKLG